MFNRRSLLTFVPAVLIPAAIPAAKATELPRDALVRAANQANEGAAIGIGGRLYVGRTFSA